MFSQCSDSHRALVDALDQGRSGRDLIQRAVRHLKVFCESSTNNVGYRLLGVPRMLLQNRPETSRQRAVKLRICPLCSLAHLFHSHFFLFETEISLGAAQISLLTRCFRWALYLRRRLLLWIKRDILSISFELASHHLVVHRRQPCQPLSIIRVAHSNFCMGRSQEKDDLIAAWPPIRQVLQTVIPPLALQLKSADQSGALIQSICSCVITFD